MKFIAGSTIARGLGDHAEAVRSFAIRHPGLVLAGGVVRDALMRRPVHDIDFSVEEGSAMAAGRAFADAVGGALVVLGQERLARVVLGGATVDFTPLRAKTLEEDLRLRDFTVNAMAVRLPWGARAEIVDPTGGMADLRAHRLRACGPGSFRADPIRLWRAHRQAVQLRLKTDPATVRLIRKDARLAAKCPAERLRDEIFKLFSGEHPAAVLRAAEASGVLLASFPVLKPMRAVKVKGAGDIEVLEHTLEALEHLDRSFARLGSLYPHEAPEMGAHFAAEPVPGRSRRALLGLAMLLHDIAKPETIRRGEDGEIHFYEHEHRGARVAAGVMRDRLRCSEGEVDVASRVIRLHLRLGYLGGAGTVTDKAAYRLIRDAGEELLELVLHSEADRLATHHGRTGYARGQRGAIRKVLEFRRALLARGSAKRLLTGRDLMRELSLAPGPVIGELLRAVDEAVALGKARTAEEAMNVAREALPGILRGPKAS